MNARRNTRQGGMAEGVAEQGALAQNEEGPDQAGCQAEKGRAGNHYPGVVVLKGKNPEQFHQKTIR
jgi:hypothetical protein